MKLSKLKTLMLLALGAGAACLTPAAHAQTPTPSHVNGDIFLGVRATGGTGAGKCYMVNLGQASGYEGLSSIKTVNVGDMGPDLSLLYGGSAAPAGAWYARSDVFWGIAGTTGSVSPVGADPAKTLFVSRQQVPAGQQSTPWSRQSNNTQGSTTSQINTMSSGYDAGSTSTPPLSIAKAISQDTSTSNNWSSFQDGGANGQGGAFNSFSGGIEASFDPGTGTSGTATSILDFYRLKPSTNIDENGAPGDYLGFFFFNDSGTLKFVPAALVGSATLAFDNTTVSAAENIGTLTVNITRSGDPSIAGTVELSTVNGTAVAGTDFTAITSQVVSFEVGETQKSVNVTIVNRDGAAAPRSFALHLANPSFGITAGGDATVTIFTPVTPSVIQFSSATFTARQDLAAVDVTFTRTGGTSAVDARVSTANGTALAGTDYTSVTNAVVSFPANVNTATLTITLLQPAGPQESKNFTVALSSPGSNASIGATSSAIVNILPADSAPPTVKITSPTASQTITATSVTFSGTATDTTNGTVAGTVAGVQVALNGNAPVAATVTPLSGGNATWILTTTAAAGQGLRGGLNTAVIKSIDAGGNLSGPVTVSFTLIEKGRLSYSAYVLPNTTSPSTSGGTVTGILTSPTAYQVGNTYTLTAKPAAGFVFDHWVIPGVATNPTSATLSLTYTDAILANPVIKAFFIVNPFAIAKVGAFNGLLTPHVSSGPSDPYPTTPSTNNTVGFLNLTVTSTGTFTGTLKIGDFNTGLTLTTTNGVKGAFTPSGDATIKVARPNDSALEVVLHLDLGGSGQITGVVNQYLRNTITATSNVLLDRANFGATAAFPQVPSKYLLNKGAYTAVLPAKAQTNGLTTTDFPQGNGFSTVSVTAAGVVTFTLTLADGTTTTSAYPLSKNLTVPLFAQLYAAKNGSISGMVTLDDLQTGSDLKALNNCLWFSPWKGGQYYPYGWPEGVTVGLVGSKYSPVAPVIPGLTGIASPNTVVAFESSSLLSSPLEKKFNVGPTNLVTKFDSTDKATLVITAASGKISGVFPHSDGTFPAWSGIIFQKSGGSDVRQGGHGFFLTTAPKAVDGTGVSGKVTLRPNAL